MGESTLLLVPFFVEEPGDEAEFVRRTVEILREHGFETTYDGCNELIEDYEADGARFRNADESLEEVAAELADASEGTITVWIDDHRIRVGYDFDADTDGEVEPTLSLSGVNEHFFHGDDVSGETARERADRIVDAIAALAVETDPWYVGGWMHPHYGLDPYPDGKPPESGVERLGWIAVFGEAFHDRFGGRQRLLETPAWNVRDLESGVVLVRRGDLPRFLDCPVDTGLEPSTDDYLFDR
ncbi:hypothetical protein AB7C87_11350 [Natrarchaeobius sp. A-rgal3]|uniref:hypothetical protein n=1 Tax=Natrarchaeobius versutus TaxID=1679078 RepID=UPI00350FADFD